MHKDLGMKLFEKLKSDLEEYGDVEREPEFEGRQMIMVVVSKKK